MTKLWIAADESNVGLDPEFYSMICTTNSGYDKKVRFEDYEKDPNQLQAIIRAGSQGKLRYMILPIHRREIPVSNHSKLVIATDFLIRQCLQRIQRPKKYDQIQVFLDGKVDLEEKNWLRKKMRNLPYFYGNLERVSINDFPKEKYIEPKKGQLRGKGIQPLLLVYAHIIANHGSNFITLPTSFNEEHHTLR